MYDEKSILDYENAPRRVRWRRWMYIAAGPALVLVALACLPGELRRTSTYIDESSGDIKTEAIFLKFWTDTTIRQTDFSKLVRKYCGPPPKPRWRFCCGEAWGIGYREISDGFEGIWPTDCQMLVKILNLSGVSEQERRQVIIRCHGFLDRDQRDMLNQEQERLMDMAESGNPATKR